MLGHSMKDMASALQNSQGHEKQGKTGKPTWIGGELGTSLLNSMLSILESWNRKRTSVEKCEI